MKHLKFPAGFSLGLVSLLLSVQPALAQFSFEPGSVTVLRSTRAGALESDHIVMDVRTAYADLISNPPKERFHFELERVLRGDANVQLLDCSCRYQQHFGGRTQDVGRILSFGATPSEALRLNQRNCVEQALEVEMMSLTQRSPGLRLQDNLWGQLGHVQSVSSHDCKAVEVPLDPRLISLYRTSLAADASRAARSVDRARPGGTSGFIFAEAPDWLRVSLATVLGGFAWRARGGGFVQLGSTQAARVLFGFLPYVFIGYINADNEEQFLDGTVMAALGALPLAAGWGDMYDMGRSNGRDGVSGNTNVDSAKYEELLAMSLRGVLQTMFASAYANARGYDNTPLTIAGAAMGGCYFTSWEVGDQNGEIDNSTLRRLELSGPTERGEMCFGAAYGYGLAQTLRGGRISEPRYATADMVTHSGQFISRYVNEFATAFITRPLERRDRERRRFDPQTDDFQR